MISNKKTDKINPILSVSCPISTIWCDPPPPHQQCQEINLNRETKNNHRLETKELQSGERSGGLTEQITLSFVLKIG